MSDLTGQCMCGAVRVTARPERGSAGACHCDMCRRWTSSALMTFPAADGWAAEGPVKVFRSSDWAERAFCETCGSPIFYRITAPGPMQGQVQMAAGLFDNAADTKLGLELYIDRKPQGYAFEGERRQMTEADVIAAFAPASNGEEK